MTPTVLALSLLALLVWNGPSQAAQQTPPPLSLVQAAQIAEKKITEAKLPADNFLHDVKIEYLPTGERCYVAFYEPPVLRGYVDGAKPAQEPPITFHFLRIRMDGTASFETKTVTPKPVAP